VIDKFGDTAVTATIVGLVTAALGWFLGTFKKVSRQDHDEEIKDIRAMIKEEVGEVTRRISKWEDTAKTFATEKMLTEWKADFEKSINRLEASINAQNAQILSLLTKKS
jgi:hypothetical protein